MTIDVRSNKTISFKIGEFDLTLSELSDESISEIDSFIQERIITIADRASRNLPSESRELILSIAIREASVAFFRSELGLKHIRTVDGMTFLLCKLAKKSHPNLTPDMLIEEMSKSEVIDEMVKKMNQLVPADSGQSVKENGEKDSVIKKKKRKTLNKEKDHTTNFSTVSK